MYLRELAFPKTFYQNLQFETRKNQGLNVLRQSSVVKGHWQ